MRGRRTHRSADEKAEAARLSVTVLVQIHRRMNKLGISRSELARRMGVSRPYISKVLNGCENLTLETVGRFGLALGVHWTIAHVLAGARGSHDSARFV